MTKAVLLVNLGTPEKPDVSSVGKYLRQFLNDRRVIDISAAGRFFLVNFIIIPFRVKRSTGLYKSIWTEKGSPLMVNSMDLLNAMRQELGKGFAVELAMRYGQPDISGALKRLRSQMPEELLVVPLYPQYSASTAASVMDDVFSELTRWEVIPSMRTISRFYDQPEFLDAWKAVSAGYQHSDYDHVLFSYHGLPERQVLKASAETGAGCCLSPGCCDQTGPENHYCYRANCFHTTRLLAERLSIPSDKYTVCFQSRLGSDEWLKPYAEDLIKKLAAEGKKKLLVFAPAFVADCLETIEEIGGEYEELFRHHGGEKLQLVPSLNAHPAWVKGLGEMVRKWLEK